MTYLARAHKTFIHFKINEDNLFHHLSVNWLRVMDFIHTFLQAAGILASYMQSSASRRFSDMMIVPSMASFRSIRVDLTTVMTFCIRSISWRRNIFSG